MAFIYDLTDTWNAGGTTFNAIKMNVTDTASAVSSKLVSLQTNGTEHFSVTKAGVGYVSGNLGVGTSSPSAKLEVVGNVLGRADNATGNSTLIALNTNVGSNTTKYSSLLLQGTDTVGTVKSTGLVLSGPSDVDYAASYMTFSTRSADALGERMRITGTGNVGIGTSSPTQRLDVSQAGGNNFAGIRTQNSNSGSGIGGIEFSSDPTYAKAAIGILRQSPNGQGSLVFYNASSTGAANWSTADERMRIDSSGNLLVGTTAAEGPGRIVSVSTASGTASNAMRNSAGAGSSLAFFINAGASSIIGSITNNADTGVLYNVTSDARLKKNIADADSASSLIDALQVRKFDWKENNNHQRYGFIAQELLEVASEAVNQPEDPDATMGVDYSKLVPMLVKELQSLRARVAQLEGN